jgi:hypothetical protein
MKRMAAGMATAVEGRIGDTKVPMSLLEKGAYINYQRIEDNLAIVRERYASYAYKFWALLTVNSGCSVLLLRKLCTDIWTTLTTRILPAGLATSSSDQM